MARDPDPPAEYWIVYNRFKEIADAVRHENGEACSVEVIPFGSTIVLDTRNHLQPMAMLRIRVAHTGDIHEPAGAAEHQAVKAIKTQLSGLGLAAGRSRA
jgi:UDP-N-acetylenolpyruvoylglucosamine reductase